MNEMNKNERRDVTTEQLLEMVDLSSPPKEAREAVRGMFSATIQPKARPTVWQRITAQLKRDSLGDEGQFALAGARDVQINREPQMNQRMFTTDVVHVLVDIIPDGDQFTIDGQLFPQLDSVSDQFVIQIIQDDQSVALVSSDDLGEFTLPNLKAGVYEMVLCSDESDVEIVIPNINLVI